MQLKKNIALSDTGFVFDPSTGNSFSTNPIGLSIIKWLKEGRSSDEIKTLLLADYSTDEATIEKDLYDFETMLTKLKLSGDEKEKD